MYCYPIHSHTTVPSTKRIGHWLPVDDDLWKNKLRSGVLFFHNWQLYVLLTTCCRETRSVPPVCRKGIVEHVGCAGVRDRENRYPIAQYELDVGTNRGHQGPIIHYGFFEKYCSNGRKVLHGFVKVWEFVVHDYKRPKWKLPLLGRTFWWPIADVSFL